MKKSPFITVAVLTGLILLLFSCKKQTSNTTGWNYNDPNFGGFENHPGYEQETGPGLVFIEGGTFAMGRTEQDVMYNWNNTPRRVTVSSFYMDETEVRNIDYREYLYWLSYVYTSNNRFIYRNALPDTLVWRERLAYNEPMVNYYLRHPAYEEYPVVGVSWVQASTYCEWRTDRVNELILLREGVIDKFRMPSDQSKGFNLDAYLQGELAEGQFNYFSVEANTGTKSNAPDGKIDDLYIAPPDGSSKRKKANVEETRRYIRMEDGIFLPRYRLPTEAEWEFAALAYIGNLYEKDRIMQRRLYPWNGNYIRYDVKGKDNGRMMANSMRGRGDAMGIAGSLNDKADITAPVRSYWPNDYGLYCMAGNVNEWVMDVYRDKTFADMEEFRPFRGNVYKEYQTYYNPEDGTMSFTPEGSNHYDFTGHILQKPVSNESCFSRENYSTADNINYLDGDLESLVMDPSAQLGDAGSFYLDGQQNKKINEGKAFPIDSSFFQIINTGSVDSLGGAMLYGAKYIEEGRILLPNGIIVVNTDDEKCLWFPQGHRLLVDDSIIEMPDGSIVDLRNGSLHIGGEDGETLYPEQLFASTSGRMYNDGAEMFGEYNFDDHKANKGGIKDKIRRPDNMSSLVSDRSRVYKGGSWKDRVYWMSPGTRRYLDENMSRADIGFRCAMTRVGSTTQGKK